MRKNKSILSAAFVMGAGLFLGSSAPVYASDIAVDDQRLVAMSRDASTPSQHAEVAKQYRLRAAVLANQAVEYEKTAAKASAQPRPPIAYKWPSMYRDAAAENRNMAVQTRRAAEEARALASYHLSRSVETGFGL